jgi:hypothetical protein
LHPPLLTSQRKGSAGKVQSLWGLHSDHGNKPHGWDKDGSTRVPRSTYYFMY